MFQELSPEAQKAALQAFRPLRVRRGGRLYAEGDRADGLYLVREGWVFLERPGPLEGPATLGVVGPGGLLGEEALVGERRRAGALALTYAELLFAPEEALQGLLARFPEVQAFLLKALYARLKAAEERLWETRHLPVGSRLARLLLGLAQGGEVAFSHQDLARMVGATRETVTKLLGEWALKGWVELGYRRVEVLDPKALARLAEAL
ncbi:cAMP-binding domain of CRP or a regulatory subunit of cAMP-dependent protein kinases [Thermus arciformis]|uniref:cAMP-binding domain of CRP or a regulatory subunit of cAMP-dependent protein kinases n=1 Tax=Thermus arciformis TaxID=482827 RepID=A0A1G7CJ80_9DEIN|nr:Crp/Fnr family transcriptional regulator [Thermus arciformis]SDE39387.1 cAMP-binding domain of CRP or a regulatory subunit of cAMP-dependent protein kinases [Thermus arciformis]